MLIILIVLFLKIIVNLCKTYAKIFLYGFLYKKRFYMNINRITTNDTVNFNALRVKKLSIAETNQLNIITKAYDKVSKRFQGFNGLYRADFKSKYPGLEKDNAPKGFFLRVGAEFKEAFHLLKFSPATPLVIKFFENGEQQLSMKKVSEELVVNTSESFENRIACSGENFESFISGILSLVKEEVLQLEGYSDVFNSIKRKITPNMNKDDVQNLVSAALIEQQRNEIFKDADVSRRLQPEILEVGSSYKILLETLYQRNGAFTARFKDAYFGEGTNHKEKGVTFQYDDSQKINLMHVKSKDEGVSRFRIVVLDNDNVVKAGYVLNTDGVVEEIKHLKHYNKLMSFNLRSLPDSLIEEFEIPQILTFLTTEVKKYKIFIDEFVQKYHIVKHRKNFETKESIEQKRIQILAEKSAKQELRQKLVEEKQAMEQARIARRQARAALKEDLLKAKLEKQKKMREKRLAKPRSNKPLLPDLGVKLDKNLTEKVVKKSASERLGLTAANLKAIALKEAEKRRLSPDSKAATEAMESIFKGNNVSSMLDVNTSRLVLVINDIFATPVKDRNPRFSHEQLSNGRIFEGRFFVKCEDGAKVSVTKVKAPRYVDFLYYSIKVEKAGEVKYVNIDPINGHIILSGADGKPILAGATVKYLSKQKFAELYPKEDNVARYLKELLTTNSQGCVVKSDLKQSRRRIVTPEEILNAELPVLDNLPDEFQNIDTLF